MSLLNLAYNSAIPEALLVEMEREAKRVGLPLATLERLGQSERLCQAFVSAAREGDRERSEFLASLIREAREMPVSLGEAAEAAAL